jgi:organic hydroperoxide reductase OsmC/OhrA
MELHYQARLIWTGAAEGPAEGTGFSRAWRVEIPGKPALFGSSDPHFAGDGTVYNPEDLLLAALGACHMLTYLALCAKARIPVIAYDDAPDGRVDKRADGRIGFLEATLRPRVVIAAGADPARAEALHEAAGRHCFIASSVNFPVRHEPKVTAAAPAPEPAPAGAA